MIFAYLFVLFVSQISKSLTLALSLLTLSNPMPEFTLYSFRLFQSNDAPGVLVGAKVSSTPFFKKEKGEIGIGLITLERCMYVLDGWNKKKLLWKPSN